MGIQVRTRDGVLVDVPSLEGNIGIPAPNHLGDIQKIQILLRRVMAMGHLPQAFIPDHGGLDSNTLLAIRQFQNKFGFKNARSGDTLIAPLSPTLLKLVELSETPIHIQKPVAGPIPRKTGAAGRELIKSFEKLMLQMYDNDGGKNCTIGYGHLLHTGACTVEDRKKYPNGITEAQAEALLAEDLRKAETVVNKYIKVPLTQNQFDALVSFAFNVGIGAFPKSNVVKRINKSDYQGALASLLRWNKADGVVQRGLIRRRNAEKNLFMKQEFAIWA